MFNFKGKKILVTGGAGFIGSNLVKSLLELDAKVIVLDNLETGNKDNLAPFLHNPKFEFYQGDICSLSDCEHVLKGVDAVSHQAALGSVPRSIAFPNRTHEINASGFLNLLHAATEANVKRFVYASSMSVYGNVPDAPIGEDEHVAPLSCYGVGKLAAENYLNVFRKQLSSVRISMNWYQNPDFQVKSNCFP